MQSTLIHKEPLKSLTTALWIFPQTLMILGYFASIRPLWNIPWYEILVYELLTILWSSLAHILLRSGSKYFFSFTVLSLFFSALFFSYSLYLNRNLSSSISAVVFMILAALGVLFLNDCWNRPLFRISYPWYSEFPQPLPMIKIRLHGFENIQLTGVDHLGFQIWSNDQKMFEANYLGHTTQATFDETTSTKVECIFEKIAQTSLGKWKITGWRFNEINLEERVLLEEWLNIAKERGYVA